MTLRLVFLHIPKTAGQSIHFNLERVFGKGAIAPVRLNSDWRRHRTEDLATYQVFSGHLDWNKLDFVPEPKVTITVTRDPLQRIVSLYLFYRKQAAVLSEDELNAPARIGMRLVRRLTCEDYFCNPDLEHRDYIDERFDNVQTYYFAGGNYTSRRRLKFEAAAAPSRTALIERAIANIASIDFVGRFRELPRLERYLAKRFDGRFDFAAKKTNVALDERDHLDPIFLAEHGFTARTLNRLAEMTCLDEELLKIYFERYDF
jgi:hypothetical protein